MGDVQVGAIAARLLQAVGQVAKRVQGSLDRHGNDGADIRERHDHIHLLGFEPPDQNQFPSAATLRHMLKDAPPPLAATDGLHAKGGPRGNLVRIEPTLEAQPTRNVPVQRLDVSLSVRAMLGAHKTFKGLMQVKPTTQLWNRSLSHNVATFS